MRSKVEITTTIEIGSINKSPRIIVQILNSKEDFSKEASVLIGELKRMLKDYLK